MDFLISSEHLLYLARLIKMLLLVEPISNRVNSTERDYYSCTINTTISNRNNM